MGRFTFQADDQAPVSGDAKIFSVKFEDPPVQRTLPVASVSVRLEPTSLAIGEKAIASASTFDADGHPLVGRGISWHSDNTAAATVSPSGEVTAFRAGSVGIVATSEGRQGNFGLVIAANEKWSGADRRREGYVRRAGSGNRPDGAPDRRSGNDRRQASYAPFGVPILPKSDRVNEPPFERPYNSERSYRADVAPEHDPFVPAKSVKAKPSGK